MSEEKRKKFGLEMLGSLHRRLKQRALDLDRPLWAVVQQAITQYLDGVKDAPEEDPDITRARVVLERGEESDAAGLRANISAFYRLVPGSSRGAAKARRKRVG